MEHYLQTLIWTMFFIVIVEMLFPSSDIKKYLKLVLSFIVLYSIISPIIDIVTASQLVPGERFSHYVNYYQSSLGQDVAYGDYEDEVSKQKEGMLAIYKAQMEKQVKVTIEKHVDVEVCDIELEAEGNTVPYEMTSVSLEVAYKEAGNGFGIGLGEKSESIVLDQDVLEKQIKNCLKDFYNWDNTNIYITVQEN